MLGNRRRCQYLPVHVDLPRGRAVLLVQRNHLAFAGADDHEIIADPRATGELRLGAHVPDLMTGVEVECRDFSLAARRIHTRALDTQAEPEPQNYALLVTDLGAPDFIDLDRRRERHQGRGLVDIFVFRAGGQEQECAEQQDPTSHGSTSLSRRRGPVAWMIRGCGRRPAGRRSSGPASASPSRRSSPRSEPPDTPSRRRRYRPWRGTHPRAPRENEPPTRPDRPRRAS